MIKYIIKNIVIFLSKILSFFIIPSVTIYLKYFRNSIYSHYFKKQLKQSGKNIFIEYPATSFIGLKYVTVGDNFNSRARLRIEAISKHLNNNYFPEVIIRNNVSINYDVHIACVNKIIIGDNVLIASKVFITDHYHGNIDFETLKKPPSLRKVISNGPVVIENNVWIGEGVAIMPNVHIGKNVIIGANAVVTKDIPDNAVVGGVPARIIKILGE